MSESALANFGMDKILEILPHRYPFLLVDRVLEIEPMKYIKTFKNLTYNEEFFQGHFPNQAIMPGVLMLEAMAQTSILLIAASKESEGQSIKDEIYVFTGIDKVKFRKQVIPGDRFEMVVENPRTKLGVWKCEAKGYVDGKVVVQAELTASSIKKK